MTEEKPNKDFQRCAEERKRTVGQCRGILHMAKQPIWSGVLRIQEEDDRGASTTTTTTTTTAPPLLAMRSLYDTEIRTLATTCQCRSRDWSKIRLVLPTNHHRSDQSALLEHLVSDCTLEDTVVLVWTQDQQQQEHKRQSALNNDHSSSSSLWDKVRLGMHSNLVVSDSVIHLNARVHRNSAIVNTYIGAHAVVIHCGIISTSPAVTSSIHDDDDDVLEITVGAEAGGGRQLQLRVESDMRVVCHQLAYGGAEGLPATSGSRSSSSSSSSSGRNDMADPMNILDHHSLVRDTPTIQDVYLHPQSSIEAGTLVQRAVLLPGATIRHASTAQRVFLQWDATIQDSSTITDCLLMEQSQAGPHSICASSVLGPDVHVAAGEVHASVIGPNTNAHHQSLLIGVLWPLGRGNVGYGANVGSNHTGRIPDQETVAGEGIFWGLSCVIKFPVDLSWAPYSIVAAGTTMPPQRVTMPFSLIVTGPTGNNQILPGWVLQNSPYTLARSEKKYETRRKAIRHNSYTGWKILRPETIELCVRARDQLKSLTTQKSSYQTDQDVPGIGANELSEKGRQAGLQAYTDCIHRFLLRSMLAYLEDAKTGGKVLDGSLLLGIVESSASIPKPLALNGEGVTWPAFPWEMDSYMQWRYQQSLLIEEFPPAHSSDLVIWARSLLERLIQLENDYAHRVFSCKQRDDIRGSQTVPGYTQSHIPADKDPVIVETSEYAKSTEHAVLSILSELERNQVQINSKL